MARRRKSDPGAALLIVVGVIFAALGQLFGCNPEHATPRPAVATAPPTQPVVATPQPTIPEPIAPAAPPQPSWRNVYISGHRVPMRADPDAKSRIVDRVDNGRLVVEYERRGNWALVEHPVTARRGWVSTKRISLSQPPDAESTPAEEDKPKKDGNDKTRRKILTDAAIVALLIRESLAEYHSHAPCACPYDHDRRGHSCGARSAWSRPGGYAPLCYPRDVSKAAIAAFRERQNSEEATSAASR